MQVLGPGLQLHDAQVHEETGEPAEDGDCQDWDRLGHGAGDHPPARALGGGGRQAEVTDKDANFAKVFTIYKDQRGRPLLVYDLIFVKISPNAG